MAERLLRGDRAARLTTSARPRPAAGQRAPLRARRAAGRSRTAIRSTSPRATRRRRGRDRGARRRDRRRVRSNCTARIAGRRAGDPRPRPARRAGADPRLRPRPHLSVRCAGRARCRTARKPLRATDYFNRLAQPHRRGAVACRPPPARSTTSTRGCGRRAREGMLAVTPRRLSRPTSATRPGPGSIWRCCRARPVYGSDAARAKLQARSFARSSARRATRRQGPRRRRRDAGGDGAAQAAVRPARHQARAGRAGRPRIRGPHAPADASASGFDPRLEDAIAALVAAGLIDRRRDPDLRLLSANAGRACGWSRRTAASRRRSRGRWSPTLCGYRRIGTRCLRRIDAGAAEDRGAVGHGEGRRRMINEGDKAPALDGRRSATGPSVDLAAPGAAAGALFLSQGRHVRLHPRGAGFHRACRRFRQGRRQGRRRVARPDEEA